MAKPERRDPAIDGKVELEGEGPAHREDEAGPRCLFHNKIMADEAVPVSMKLVSVRRRHAVLSVSRGGSPLRVRRGLLGRSRGRDLSFQALPRGAATA
jgi:hypothetical protein